MEPPHGVDIQLGEVPPRQLPGAAAAARVARCGHTMVDAIAPRDRDMLLDINMALNSLHFKGLLNESIFGMEQQAGWSSIQITSIVFGSLTSNLNLNFISTYIFQRESHIGHLSNETLVLHEGFCSSNESVGSIAVSTPTAI